MFQDTADLISLHRLTGFASPWDKLTFTRLTFKLTPPGICEFPKNSGGGGGENRRG